MDADRERWDERHRSAVRPRPAPPEALAGRHDLLALVPTTGGAVDVAAGTGAVAVWLAGAGLDVVALDISPVAVARCRALATEHGVTDRVDARVHDLDAGLPDDLAGLGLVVCQRFHAPGLDDDLVGALAPRGVCVVTVLSTVGREGPTGPYHAAAGELVRRFDRPDVELLSSTEADGVASVVLRRS